MSIIKYDIDNELLKVKEETWGKADIDIVLAEECGELVQACTKSLRGMANLDNMAEEMADVIISIEAAMAMHGIKHEDVQYWIDKKLIRLRLRLKKEGAKIN